MPAPITPDAAAAFNAANAAFREGRFAEAVEAAARAVARAPELASAHVLKARALRRLGDEPAARVAYEAALRIDPKCFDALLEHGNVLRGLGEAYEAAASYTAAMAARLIDARPALALARRWPVCAAIWSGSVWSAPICRARLRSCVRRGCWRDLARSRRWSILT